MESARLGKSSSRVLGEEGDREAVDGKLDFVGGEVEGQPSHGERAVELY